MKSKLMWLIYFIASFGAFHHGLALFGHSLLVMPFVMAVPMLSKIILGLFLVCGFISMVSLFMPCKESCK